MLNDVEREKEYDNYIKNKDPNQNFIRTLGEWKKDYKVRKNYDGLKV